jgi:hypothetical protein
MYAQTSILFFIFISSLCVIADDHYCGSSYGDSIRSRLGKRVSEITGEDPFYGIYRGCGCITMDIQILEHFLIRSDACRIQRIKRMTSKNLPADHGNKTWKDQYE